MPTIITVTAKPPFRDIHGRFVKATDELLAARRDEARALGSKLASYIKAEAPHKTGKYISSIGYQTFIHGKDMGFRIYAAQPLTTYLTQGTRPHVIMAKRSSVLAFFWEGGPRGAGMYFFKVVHHPGTKANPFIEKALQKFSPEPQASFMRMAGRWAMKMAGK